MTTNDKVAKLRGLFKENGVSAYVIPNSDPHISEYIPEYYSFRTYFSGFDGSAGTAIVSEKKSGLWTDGRYFIQAEKQISGSEIELYKMGVSGVPTIEEFLVDELENDQVIGLDGYVVSTKFVQNLLKAGKKKNITVKEDLDLSSVVWDDGSRPELPETEIFEYQVKYAGKTATDKIQKLRGILGENAILVTKLDSIAWLFNIRAHDVAYNPLAVAYALVTKDKAYLFTKISRVNDDVKTLLTKSNVELMEYMDVKEVIQGISTKTEIFYDEDYTNYSIYKELCANNNLTPLAKSDIVTVIKATKNVIEIENMTKANIKDGCAMVSVFMELEQALATGKKITEYDVSQMLIESRAKQHNNMGVSFTSIIAYRANAAMMHYAPTPESHSVLEPKDMLLLDSGGQYLEGTCDITRTIPLGEVCESHKKDYTIVLQAMLGLATAKFLRGTIGTQLDMIARHRVWEYGIDYRCGTGHGVGCYLCVHEGPHSVRKDVNTNPIEEGMVITDEPGIYTEGSHGIRIENMLVAYLDETNEYGDFLKFKNISCFPIDTRLVVKEMLSKKELDWLNDYNKHVYDTLSQNLSDEQNKWLKIRTLAI